MNKKLNTQRDPTVFNGQHPVFPLCANPMLSHSCIPVYMISMAAGPLLCGPLCCFLPALAFGP